MTRANGTAQGIDSPGGSTIRGRPTPVAFFSVKTQFENVGDALITRELVRLVSASASTFVDLSRCPPAFRATLKLNEIPNVRCYERAGFVRLAAKLFTCRLSGDRAFYFLSPGGRGSEVSRAEYLRGRIFNGLLRTLRVVGTRVCHVGVSYDHLGSRHAKLLRSRVKLLAFHGVRDRATAEHLVPLGVRVDEILPDLAVTLFPTPSSPSDDRPVVVALSFRNDKYTNDDIDTLVQTVLTIVEDLPEGSRVKIVSQVSRDDRFSEDLREYLRDQVQVHVATYHCSSSIEDCVATYSDCDRIYSNRLHALLLAASAGATPVALVHPQADVKIIGVFEELGLFGHVVALPCKDTSRLLPSPLNQEHLGRAAERLRGGLRGLLAGSERG